MLTHVQHSGPYASVAYPPRTRKAIVNALFHAAVDWGYREGRGADYIEVSYLGKGQASALVYSKASDSWDQVEPMPWKKLVRLIVSGEV
jgi:hypothetical protein